MVHATTFILIRLRVQLTLDDKLENALLWMFERGIANYYSNMSEYELRKLFTNETGTELSGPISYEPITVLHYRFWDSGISKRTNTHTTSYLFISCYVQDISNNVVEYWVVKRLDKNYIDNKCRFIITVANTLRSSRRIIVDTDEFIESIEISGRTIRFPKDNLRILDHLDARRWPKSFTNTDLADYKVVFDRNNVPRLRKIGSFERSLFNARYRIPKD